MSYRATAHTAVWGPLGVWSCSSRKQCRLRRVWPCQSNFPTRRLRPPHQMPIHAQSAKFGGRRAFDIPQILIIRQFRKTPSLGVLTHFKSRRPRACIVHGLCMRCAGPFWLLTFLGTPPNTGFQFLKKSVPSPISPTFTSDLGREIMYDGGNQKWVRHGRRGRDGAGRRGSGATA